MRKTTWLVLSSSPSRQDGFLLKQPPTVRVTLPDDHPLFLTWRQWWSYECSEPLPALRLILIWDNLAEHLLRNMVR